MLAQYFSSGNKWRAVIINGYESAENNQLFFKLWRLDYLLYFKTKLKFILLLLVI